jgi:TolB-like protein
VSDEVLTQRVAEIRKAFKDSAKQSEIIETIPKVGFRLIPPVTPLSENATTNQAIAVLPFVNMSGDPDSEYFSDGISEELINLLVKVPDLHVISRTSSFSFKGERLKIADLAKELNASLIVEGTVRKVDNSLRITAQLIDAKCDKHLLSQSYDRELSDIFSLQEELAQSIVTKLQDKIGAHSVTVRRPTENVESYDLFLLGRQRFYQRGAAMDSAITALQMAVEKDPEFSEAWAYLAAAAVVAWGYQTAISDEEAFQIAEQAASRALELDRDLGLALAAQAIIACSYEAGMKKGFDLIDHAVEVDPHDTTIRLWAGMYYHLWGYLEQAFHHFKYAHTHDPRVGMTNGMLGQNYLAQGRDGLAAPRLARATELGWPLHLPAQASQHMMRGEVDAAFAFLKFTFTDPQADSDPLSWIHELEEAGRSYIADTESMGALISILKKAPEWVAFTDLYLTLLFNLKDQFFKNLSCVAKESRTWPTFVMPTLWLPEYQAYVEDPRFFEIIRDYGALELWEQRGFPDGCIRVIDRAGDHLDCSRRYK